VGSGDPAPTHESRSCGMADQVSLGQAEGPKARRAGVGKGGLQRRCRAIGKDGRREKSERWTTRRSYTPRKRRPARARALPDAAVAVS
jgi:hypothetical protein